MTATIGLGVVEEGRNRAGYERLVIWRNAYMLRRRIYEITKRFSKTEMRRVAQMCDAARSVKQNIQEGYARGSLREYVQALRISRGSLNELDGDIQDCLDDDLISQEEFSELDVLIGRTKYLFRRLLTALEKPDVVQRWQKR